MNKIEENKKRKLQTEIENDINQIKKIKQQIENTKKQIENTKNQINIEENKIRKKNIEEQKKQQKKKQKKREDKKKKNNDDNVVNDFIIVFNNELNNWSNFEKDFLVTESEWLEKIMKSDELDKKDYFETIKKYSIDKIKDIQIIDYLIIMTKLNYGTITNKEIEKYYDYLIQLMMENKRTKELNYSNRYWIEKGKVINLLESFDYQKLKEDIYYIKYIINKLIKLPSVQWKPKYHKYWIRIRKESKVDLTYKLEYIERFDKIKIATANKEILNKKILLLLLISKHRNDSKDLVTKLMMIKGITFLIIEELAYHFKINKIIR